MTHENHYEQKAVEKASQSPNEIDSAVYMDSLTEREQGKVNGVIAAIRELSENSKYDFAVLAVGSTAARAAGNNEEPKDIDLLILNSASYNPREERRYAKKTEYNLERRALIEEIRNVVDNLPENVFHKGQRPEITWIDETEVGHRDGVGIHSYRKGWPNIKEGLRPNNDLQLHISISGTGSGDIPNDKGCTLPLAEHLERERAGTQPFSLLYDGSVLEAA